MQDETLPQDSLSDDGLEPNSDGQDGGSEVAAESLSLEEINQSLGKNFKDKATALKAVKDTFNYVGKKKEDVAKETSQEIDTSKFVPRDEFEASNFYAKNPEFEPYKDVLSKLRQEGQSLEEVVKSDSFKPIFEKISAYDKQESSKSILQSNPRLGQITDKMTKAKEAVGASKDALLKGDSIASENAFREAKTNAVNAVLDTLE